VRISDGGTTAVVSGDYKLSADPTCRPFEPLRCDVFVSEATFGLPIYRWPATSAVMAGIRSWWQDNQRAGRSSVLCAYALGKAQRLLAELGTEAGPIFAHGAVARYLEAYRAAGVPLPPVAHARAAEVKAAGGKGLILAPPSVLGSPWLRRLGLTSTAFVSGWMLIRGRRRQRHVDCGFVLSDHADWTGLVEAIRATQARQVYLTHGYARPLARWLGEQGIGAAVLETRYGDTAEDEVDEPQASAGDGS
jgi:putative mRNA 3-end processing factor